MTQINGAIAPTGSACLEKVEILFREALQATFGKLIWLPIADGAIHRFHVPGDRQGSHNGWCVLFADGVAAGAFGSWKAGAVHHWSSRGEVSAVEAEQMRQRIEQVRHQRELVQMSAAESTFGSLAEMAKSYAGESSGIYRAMFAVEKGIALARAAVAIQEGIALAAANPFPLNLAAMAAVAAETASIVGNIAAIGLDGFEVGGYTGNGGIHDVAGFVHGKEFVFDAASTARIGVGNLEAMRSGKLDASINKASAAIAETNNDNRITSINVTVALPGGGSTKEQRASGAKIGRQIARAVDAAQRYN